MTDLPSLGHIDAPAYLVADAVTEFNYVARGRHLLLGQRRNRGSTDGLILLGKCIERGRVQNFFDANVWLDVEHPHVIFISGKRGSGKSYDLGVIVEGLVLGRESKVASKAGPITTVFFDTQNQFWTLGVDPDASIPEDREQLQTLERWSLVGRGIPGVVLMRPRGTPILGAGELEFTLATGDLTVEDWCGLLGVERFSPMGQLMRRVHALVATEGWTDNASAVPASDTFELTDVLACLANAQELLGWNQGTREGLRWRIESLSDIGVFAAHGLSVLDLLRRGQVSVFLLRELDDATKAVLVSVIARRIFTVMGSFQTRQRVSRRFASQQTDSDLPGGVWMVIDEAHVVAPSDRPTAARGTLVEYVKRGRDAGLSLLLATQQPSALDPAILSQVDVNLTHRLVFDPDIDAAVARFPSRLPRSVKLGDRDISEPSDLVRSLRDGQALIGDAESGRGVLIAIRPRISPHGGREPSVLDDADPS